MIKNCPACRKVFKTKLKAAIEKANRYAKRDNLPEMVICQRVDKKGFIVCAPQDDAAKELEIVQYLSYR